MLTLRIMIFKMYYIHDELIYEPLCDKTNNLALRPGPTQRDVQRQNKAKKLKSSDLESRGIVLSVWGKQRR